MNASVHKEKSKPISLLNPDEMFKRQKPDRKLVPNFLAFLFMTNILFGTSEKP